MLALLAAGVFGVAVAFQLHEASALDTGQTLRPGMLVRLVRRPLWLVGLGGDVLGFGLQTAALSVGSLVVVQPVLTTALLVSLGVGARLARRRLRGWEWRAVAGVVGGLVVFLLVARPTEHSDAVASARGWWTAAAIIVAVVGLGLAAGRRAQLTSRAVMFGFAAAWAEAMMAVVSKAFGDRLGDGVVGTLSSWEPYALAGWGMVTLVVVQSAYQIGLPTVTLPITTVVEPLVATTIGVALFHERIHIGPERVVLIVLALSLMVRSLVVLARDPAQVRPDRQPAQDPL